MVVCELRLPQADNVRVARVFVFEACVWCMCALPTTTRSVDDIDDVIEDSHVYAIKLYYVFIDFHLAHVGITCYRITGAECRCMNEALIVTDFIEIDLRFYFQFN